MKNLLLVGAAILAFKLFNDKPLFISSVSKIGSKEIGYEIIDCEKLTIYNQEKAFKYAYALGVSEINKVNKDDSYQLDPNKLLLGKCKKISEQLKKLINSKEKASFIFELYNYLYSGLSFEDDELKEEALNDLTKLKSKIEELGFNTEDLIVELKV